MNGLNGVLFYDNAETDITRTLKFDATTAEEEYVIWHSGNRPIAVAVADIPDPTTATTEEVANKINELLLSLRNANLLST
jgi:hypothetical protein